MKLRLLASFAAIGIVTMNWQAPVASAGSITAFFETLDASTTVAPTLGVGDTLFLDSVVTSATGALSQSITFTIGDGVTGFSGQAAWMVSTAPGPGPRLVGVNIDVFNAATGALVTSDSIAGVLSGVARSSLANPVDLAAGTYTVVVTGTGVREAVLDVALSLTGPGSPASPGSTGGVPDQGASTAGSTVFFNQLIDSRVVTSSLGAGSTLIVDSLVTDATDALSHTVTFTLGAGVDGITGAAEWFVSEAAGAGPRLVGVNVDLFDSSGTFLASDTFDGLLANIATSSFDVALTPGTYTLVATGTGQRASSLTIALGITGIADPGVTPVPEPGSIVLLLGGLAAATGLTAHRRRRAGSISG